MSQRYCVPYGLQGYLSHKKSPPFLRPPVVPRQTATVGSSGGVFLMSEEPLYGLSRYSSNLVAVRCVDIHVVVERINVFVKSINVVVKPVIPACIECSGLES
jgi:hypothetical protein